MINAIALPADYYYYTKNSNNLLSILWCNYMQVHMYRAKKRFSYYSEDVWLKKLQRNLLHYTIKTDLRLLTYVNNKNVHAFFILRKEV